MAHRWSRENLRHRFTFSVPPEGWDAAYGNAEGARIEGFIREWAGPLRRGAPTKIERDRRWARLVPEIHAELVAAFEEEQALNLGLNGSRPTRRTAAATLAERYPGDLPKGYTLEDGTLDPKQEQDAIDLILGRVKRLQNTGK